MSDAPLELTQLGNKVELPEAPDFAVIETVPAPEPFSLLSDSGRISATLTARFCCPEFTSLCPVTGQPDFANMVIDYVPRSKLVESKSLKLFLGSFRNHRAFHETTTQIIGARLSASLDPVWLRISAFWYARGGIPIDVFWEFGRRPEGCYVPHLNRPPFNAR